MLNIAKKKSAKRPKLKKHSFNARHHDYGTLTFKGVTKKKGAKRRAGGYSYTWTGRAYTQGGKKFLGIFKRRTDGNLKSLKGDINAGLVTISKK